MTIWEWSRKRRPICDSMWRHTRTLCLVVWSTRRFRSIIYGSVVGQNTKIIKLFSKFFCFTSGWVENFAKRFVLI